MRLPRYRQVSDLLHEIADLVQEADTYLCEGKLFKSCVKPLPAPKAQTSGGQREPHKADRVTNRLRKSMERVNKPKRDLFRAERERKQRSRYKRKKLVQGVPRKSFGTRFRIR